jgi:hypothetical protein
MFDEDDGIHLFEEIEDEEGNIRYRRVSGGGFFSTVENALAGIKQEKGTPEQFKAMLLKGGAAQAEMDWLGWDEFAGGRKSVTKAEVKAWTEENGIVLGEKWNDNYSEKELKESLQQYAREVGQQFHTAELYDKYEKSNFGKKEGEAYKAAQNKADELIYERHKLLYKDFIVGKPKYTKYTVKGGKRYRELLLTIPATAEGDNYRSSHWKRTPNVVAHVRYDTRKAADGGMCCSWRRYSRIGRKTNARGRQRRGCRLRGLRSG